jgi:hypothetical protein
MDRILGLPVHRCSLMIPRPLMNGRAIGVSVLLSAMAAGDSAFPARPSPDRDPPPRWCDITSRQRGGIIGDDPMTSVGGPISSLHMGSRKGSQPFHIIDNFRWEDRVAETLVNRSRDPIYYSPSQGGARPALGEQ